jgi:hypothetical protein
VELRSESSDGLLVGMLTDHGLHRIPRCDVKEQERNNENAEQRRYGQE